jgi:hypothetical protein
MRVFSYPSSAVQTPIKNTYRQQIPSVADVFNVRKQQKINHVRFMGTHDVSIPEKERAIARQTLGVLLGLDNASLSELQKAIDDKEGFSTEIRVDLGNDICIPIYVTFEPSPSIISIELERCRGGAFFWGSPYLCRMKLDDQNRPMDCWPNSSTKNQRNVFYWVLKALTERAGNNDFWLQKIFPVDKNTFSPSISEDPAFNDMQLLSKVSHPKIKVHNVPYLYFEKFYPYLLSLPEPLQDFILREYTIYLSDFVISIRDDLKGKKAYGHGEDRYWDNMVGLHDRTKNMIIIAFNYYPSHTNHQRSESSSDPGATLQHEVGHAILWELGRLAGYDVSISTSVEIKSLFQQDKQQWIGHPEEQQFKSRFKDKGLEEVGAYILQALLADWAAHKKAIQENRRSWSIKTNEIEALQAFPKLSVELAKRMETAFNFKLPPDWIDKYIPPLAIAGPTP